MKRGRYNIQLPDGTIKKFNVYMNDYHNMFIYLDKEYQQVVRFKSYRGGWLWKLKSDVDNCAYGMDRKV